MTTATKTMNTAARKTAPMTTAAKATRKAKPVKLVVAAEEWPMPHPDYNSPISGRLTELLMMLEDTEAALRAFVSEVDDLPGGELPDGIQYGDEWMERIRGLALIVGDQVSNMVSPHCPTNAQHAAWRAGARLPGFGYRLGSKAADRPNYRPSAADVQKVP